MRARVFQAAPVLLLLAWGWTAQAQTFGDWQLVQADGECLLVQSVMSRSSGTTLAQVVLQRQGDAATLALQVPNGASLGSGIGYRVATGEPYPLQWITCGPELCLALRPLPDGELRGLQRGRDMLVGYRPLPGSRPINLTVSLMGVTAGWNALKDCPDSNG